ncbi:CBS domain containing-hemolysin-like protein [Kineosphaera limosa]|uniref:CNNM transmembrane domain-containing protein n=1 Tax=Kineosphaera limosa NBRC 100340 TaxID=1184609 RepID=K6WZG3_9MICO|nr:hemolysin family protein [Kineosphaera limosa]NYE00117.1 CBS domain containing-hemolysin-like protein [Kineosphaera limosa]GAB97512.1 hypothetical protein KILIM_072_00210 [Kineosphaera limosa NBRC 100340]
MNGWVITLVTIGIVALSAFFVAVEFSLISAKRHRIEDAATTSRSARAALRSSAELTLLLAGSQLGITVCTLALGAITKPALHDALMPLLDTLGLSATVADVTAFVLALVIATFLHLVVGEMMPKSWAIAHPEKSATMLAIPMRGFMWVTRPILRALNASANWLLQRFGVEPVDEVATGRDPDTLRQLVEHSANVGALDAGYRMQIEGALQLRKLRLAQLVRAGRVPSALPLEANVRQVQDLARRSGHLRVLLRDGDKYPKVVHVRDTLAAPDTSEPAIEYARDTFELPGDTLVHEALATMRETQNHLVVVTEKGEPIGVVTLADILTRLLPTATASSTPGTGPITLPRA